MYEKFYGFAEKPFNLTPDPDYFFLSSVHKRALDHLVYGLESGMGFIQVTGEIGSGKTTLIKCLLRQLSREVKVAYIIHSKGTFVQILRMILEDLEIAPADQKLTKEALLSRLRDYLVQQARYHNSVVVIIDEAQNLQLEALEELRMLSNFETEKAKLLQIVLVGQPELRDLLRRPELEQLRQRITVRFHLYPLSEEETRSYIRHRLKVAGSNGSVRFTAAASRIIHRYSGGLPRLINVACDATLLAGFVDERRVFNEHFVVEALRELADERAGFLDDGGASAPPQAGDGRPLPAVGAAAAERAARPARGRVVLAAAVAVLLAIGLAAALFFVWRGGAEGVGELWRGVPGVTSSFGTGPPGTK